MDKKIFALTQHWLIPLALIAGNIALARLIYLLAKGHDSYALISTLTAVVTLTIAILRPNKYLLFTAIIFYTILLCFSLSRY